MHPTLIEIPFGGSKPLTLHSYGFMIVVGFLLTIWLTRKEFLRRGLPDVAYDLGLVMLLCGLVGGRLFYYVQFFEAKFRGESFLEFFRIWKGGLVFYGGAVGGLVGGILYVWKKKLPLADCMDAVAMFAPIGMAFGRIGCFLNGCCFGGLCDPSHPCGVVFPPGSAVHEHQWGAGLLGSAGATALPVHAAQLYQAAHDVLLVGLLVGYLRRADAVRGGGMPLLFALYGVGRFSLELLRGDTGLTPTGLTVGQNVSLVLTAVFGGLFLMLLILQRKWFTSEVRIP